MTKVEFDNGSTTLSKDTKILLHVLGGFDLRDNENRPIELKARKSRLLLAYLAVPSGQLRSREQLASLLWSDRQDEQARASLRNALSGIRRAIGNDALVVEHDSIKLRPGYISTDYDQLEKVSAGANQISKLQDFYAGEFLAGHEYDGEIFSDWLRGYRAECTEIARIILENNADRFAKSGDHNSAIDLMRESLSLEPLKEQTHRTIMLLYAATGEKAMALAQFRTCKELLLHELNAEPDPETQALADNIAMQNTKVAKSLHDEAGSILSSLDIPEISATEHDLKKPLSISDVPSIAVLPFVNMSGDAEQNYFVDGMTEDIITDLSDIDDLSVIAKNSSQMYRGVSMSAPDIAQELGVQYILDGSVRKSGQELRISTQLTDAETNHQLWAERFDRRLENVFELQSEIAQAIVKALKLKLTPSTEKSTVKRSATSVEAYEYYLRGRSLLRETSKRSIELARELFERVVVIDPNYAPAYTGLADCATILLQHYDVDAHVLDDALSHCDKALQIDPMLAEAYAARGYILTHKADPKAAEENLIKAVSLAPKLADAHHYLGKFYLGVANDPEKSVASFKTAFELSQDLRTGSMLLTSLHAAGRMDETEFYGDQIINLSKRRVALNPYDYSATLNIASTYARLGVTDEAIYWANIASAFDTQDGAFTYNLACAHAILGQVEEALVQLEITLNLGCSKVKVHYMTVTDPDLDLVRKDARFKALIKGYWRRRALARKKSGQKLR